MRERVSRGSELVRERVRSEREKIRIIVMSKVNEKRVELWLYLKRVHHLHYLVRPL